MIPPLIQPPVANRQPNRPAFTLVELMVVIAIIGILSAVLIPAVTGAIRTAKEAAIRTEIGIVDQACEAYKLKYGDYPPDFSDWNSVERHFRKAFPEIDDRELKILAQFTFLDADYARVPMQTATDPRPTSSGYAYYRQCMDPAEALVFCLGGYSSDAKKPFTGQGGPLAIVPSSGMSRESYASYQYNSERDNAFMELDSTQLSIQLLGLAGQSDPLSLGSPQAYTYSSDEFTTQVINSDLNEAYSTRNFGNIRFLLDPFPTYRIGDVVNPIVYFNSRTYDKTFAPTLVTGGWVTNATAGPHHSLNIYLNAAGDPEQGVARPYKSLEVDTKSAASSLFWIEKNRFQLISPGLDDSFGGEVRPAVFVPATPATAAASGRVAVYSSGEFVDALSVGLGSGRDKYEDDESVYGGYKPQFDNITNFSTRTLESDLP